MQHPLDLAVEFLDATKPELVDLILALTTNRPSDGPLPAVVDIIDLTPDDPTEALFYLDPLQPFGYSALPLTTTQNRTLRELLNLHQWACSSEEAEVPA
jgi:hypothetical protein